MVALPVDLVGRVAHVTGGGGGIGATAVRVLLDLGAKVIVSGRRSAALEAVRQFDPRRVYPVQMDVSREEEWRELDARLPEDWRTTDVLITAAGVNLRGPFVESMPSEWDEMWRINVKGTLLAVRYTLPGMLRRGWGRVVLVSSVGARIGLVDRAFYSATKGAIEAFGRSLAAEVAGSGVLVNMLAPGAFPTELNRRWLDTNREIREDMLRTIPEGRFGEVEELREAFRYLVTTTYTQGSTVVVDGGWSIV